ncbi:MAG: flagellar motor switch protein FliN [Brevinema sp.]
MSDSVLSQDELDALLQGTSLENNDSENLSNTEETVLNKLFNEIGVARVAILSQLTNTSISLENIVLLTGSKAKIIEDLTMNIVGNTSSVTGNISGSWMLGAPENTVFQITNPMLDTESTELSNDVISAFGEVISTVIASDTKILSEKLSISVSPSLSESQKYDNGDSFIDATGSLCRIGMHLNVNGASYTFYTISSTKFMKNIAKILIPTPNKANESNTANADTKSNPNAVNMTSAQFQQFSVPNSVEPLDNLALLLDVPMRVTVELGRTRMTIKDILNLGEGSIVELEKLAGEPVDVLVNDKLIALGEVVVIDENFSVRVTKVVTPMERLFDRENLHGKGGV